MNLFYTLQNEMIINQTYFTTWYDLPAKFRKMFHILQGQIRKPIKIYVFLLYPVTMITFAQAVKFVYSVINLFRTTSV